MHYRCVSSMRLTLAAISTLAIANAGNAAPPNDTDSGFSIDVNAALARFQAANPRVAFYRTDQRITRVYGRSFAFGDTPVEAAQSFLREHAEMFGVTADELVLQRTATLMRDQRFTAVYYDQIKRGLPVGRAGITLLVRHDFGNGVVLASVDLHDLSGQMLAPRSISGPDAVAAVAEVYEGFEFTQPELIVHPHIEPTFAYRFEGRKNKNQADHEKYEFIVDASRRAGAILETTDLILKADIRGNVSGFATEGLPADLCAPEAITPLPHLKVSVDGGNSAFTDENGDFTIPHAGNDPVTVVSTLAGRWFQVVNNAGTNARIEKLVTPPGPADFEHNADGGEFRTAEVNAYHHANLTRDMAMFLAPYYRGRLDHTNFAVNVNLSSSCNAFYTGDAINFFRRNDTCDNFAFSSIIEHEYGHHLVRIGGSGQGQYGEGASDACGVVINDDPGGGYGFRIGQCETPGRNAENVRNYPCSGGIHDCGQLLSGVVWETRNELKKTNPDTYLDIVRELWFNSIPLHRGDLITPQVTIDWLTLDDNDDDIGNGTPHYWEIDAGFSKRRMPAPPLRFKAGDVNCDGSIDLSDVAPFIVALTDRDEYMNKYPLCHIHMADMNQDGSVDLLDVETFIEVLIDP